MEQSQFERLSVTKLIGEFQAKNPTLDPILSQINPAHVLTFCSLCNFLNHRVTASHLDSNTFFLRHSLSILFHWGERQFRTRIKR